MVYLNFLNLNLLHSRDTFGIMIKATTTYFMIRQHLSTGDNDINTYANNINTTIITIAKEWIPNRHIRIKPSEPPWINSTIKRNIRKRKRAYRKVKKTNLESDWEEFKKNYATKLFKLFETLKNHFTTNLQLNLHLRHFPLKTGGLH